MFLIDDLLLSPMRGLGFIFRSIHEAAQTAEEDEVQALKSELQEMYMRLELGEVTEEEFDAREEEILARLDSLELGSEST